MSGYTHPALRLTPANSPFFRNTPPRSPTKGTRNEEPGLQLRKVIGTTTASINGFDCLPSARSFAFTAGAAAVLATLDQDLNITQRFFRARPSSASSARDSTGWPTSPTPNEPRHRNLAHIREKSANGSPLASGGRDWNDSPTGKTTTAKDRVKAATSVAISPNGKWLAVGESGYRPRIAIFSLEGDLSEDPIAILSEHSFGVHALRFSPDSRFLASLGTVNDGFLFVWSIDKLGMPNLHASNKLTTLTNAIAWVATSLVTAGLRYAKVWRPGEDYVEPRLAESTSVNFLSPRARSDVRVSDFGNSILSPKHRTLSGKNSLLGDLLDCNFVAIVPVSQTQAIVCAETGEICLINDVQGTQTLSLVTTTEFVVSTASVNSAGVLHVYGMAGQVETLEPAEYLEASRPSSGDRRQTAALKRLSPCVDATIAACWIGNASVRLSSERVISVRVSDFDSPLEQPRQLPAHKHAVQGVSIMNSAIHPAARFLTFTADGSLCLWTASGDLVARKSMPVLPSSMSGDTTNELKCTASSSDGGWVACGDRTGVLSLLDLSTDKVICQVRGHSSEITAVTTFCVDGVAFVVSAGRDRMVQVFTFADGKLLLRQTLDEHAGAVSGIIFEVSNNRLITHSADRSIVVRDGVLRDPERPDTLVFAMLRTIALKATPTSMCLAGTDELFIATVDRCVSRYNLKNGQCSLCFKCSDPDGGEAAVMSKLSYAPAMNGCPTIAGVSSTDKSVRLYTEYGSLIARDWGHTEGITDVVLFSDEPSEPTNASKLVTVAADSTIFIWDTKSSNPSSADVSATNKLSAAFGEDSTSASPLRKVISHTELSRFRRRASGEDSEPSSPSISTHLTTSPQRLRRKTSRISIASTPRLEPESPRRRTIRRRSPSPPSPRNTLKQGSTMRRRSMANIRTKSSDIVTTDSPLPTIKASPSDVKSNVATSSGGPGSLPNSTTALSRSLRAYRKRLTASAAANPLPTEALRDLERELKLTSKVLAERLPPSKKEEAMMARLLDDASGKLVGLLDERIKERVETEVRKGSGSSLGAVVETELKLAGPDSGDASTRETELEAVTGALQSVMLADQT